MAKINKQEVLQEMQEGLRLDTALEKTPQELAEKILPVYKVNPQPRIIRIEGLGFNSSNKSFTVPVGRKWKLLYGSINYASTATVGDRQLLIRFRSSNATTIYEIQALNVQIASTTEIYNLGQFGDVSEGIAGNHLIPIPINSILIENFSIQILDSAAIAATADDMLIRLVVEETDMNPNR